MREYLGRVLSLLVTALLLASAVAYTGRLFGYNINPSDSKAEQTQVEAVAPDTGQLQQLGLSGSEPKPIGRGAWRVSGGIVVLNSAAFTDKVFGYAGLVPVYIAIDHGVVSSIALGSNCETPRFLERVTNAGLPERWVGLDAAKARSLKVDAVSGATYSSGAIISAVQQTLDVYTNDRSRYSAAPVIGWGRTIAVLLVVVSGLCMSLFKMANARLRVVQLCLNIVVLGFWCGQFISMSLLMNWLGNGVQVVANLSMVVIVAVALLLPLFGHKGHYCAWICPYGSAQELIGRCTLHKLSISPAAMKLLAHSREVLLMALLVMLWLGVGLEIVNYEPFSAFLFTVASPVVITIAALFLVLSLFVVRPWCRFVCPTGQLLSWAQKIK